MASTFDVFVEVAIDIGYHASMADGVVTKGDMHVVASWLHGCSYEIIFKLELRHHHISEVLLLGECWCVCTWCDQQSVNKKIEVRNSTASSPPHMRDRFFRSGISLGKRSFAEADSVHVRVGIEIETCVLFPDYEELNGTLRLFRSDTDGSIRCPTDMGQMRAVEYILDTPMDVDPSDLALSASYQAAVEEMRLILAAAHKCADADAEDEEDEHVSSCGTHLHMSVPITVEENPLLFHTLQQLWINRWAATPRMGTRQRAAVEIAYLAKHSLRQSSSFAMPNREVKPLVKLNKYEALNLKPTFADYPFEYHVEFRSAGDFVTAFGDRGQGGERHLHAFTEYVRDMARFLQDAVHATTDAGAVARIDVLDLSGLRLRSTSGLLQAPLNAAASLVTLNLAENELTWDGVAPLLGDDVRFPALVRLWLQNQRNNALVIPDEQVALVEGFVVRHARTLRELFLHGNQVGSAIAARVGTLVRLARVNMLQLDSSPLDRASVRYATDYQLNSRVPSLLEVQREELARNRVLERLSCMSGVDVPLEMVQSADKVFVDLLDRIPYHHLTSLSWHTNVHYSSLMWKGFGDAVLRNCPRLTHLNIHAPVGDLKISDALARIVNDLPQLTHFNDCRLMRDHPGWRVVGELNRAVNKLDVAVIVALRLPMVRTIAFVHSFIDLNHVPLLVVPDSLRTLHGRILDTSEGIEAFLNAQPTPLHNLEECRVFPVENAYVKTHFSEDVIARMYEKFPNANLVHARDIRIVVLNDLMATCHPFMVPEELRRSNADTVSCTFDQQLVDDLTVFTWRQIVDTLIDSTTIRKIHLFKVKNKYVVEGVLKLLEVPGTSADHGRVELHVVSEEDEVVRAVQDAIVARPVPSHYRYRVYVN